MFTLTMDTLAGIAGTYVYAGLNKKKNDLDDVLHNICLEIQTNGLVAYATDRYRIARYAGAFKEDYTGGDFKVLIPGQWFVDTVKKLKASRATQVNFKIDNDTLTVKGWNGEQYSISLPDAPFPDVDRFFNLDDSDRTAEAGFNADVRFLSELSKVPRLVPFLKNDAEVRFRFYGTGKPIYVEFDSTDDGHVFDAVFIPRRTHDSVLGDLSVPFDRSMSSVPDFGGLSPVPVDPTPVDPTPVEVTSVDGSRTGESVEADRFASVPGLTVKMRERIVKGAEKGFSGSDLASYVLGARSGMRFEALVKALAA